MFKVSNKNSSDVLIVNSDGENSPYVSEGIRIVRIFKNGS